MRPISRHSSNRNTCNSGNAWTHTVRGFPPTFTRNLDTFAKAQPCFRSVCGLRTSPRSTNEQTRVCDLASGDSYRLETAKIHAHWYCRASVRFSGRFVCCNMLADDGVRSRQSTPSHTSPKLQFVRKWSIDRFQLRDFLSPQI